MSETKLYNFRLPIELMECAKVQAGAAGVTSMLLSLLRQHLGGETPSQPITAQFPDGGRRVIGTGHEGGIVTTANAGAIILELQDRISALETELGDLDLAGVVNDRVADAERRVDDLKRQLGMWQARAERAEHAAKVMADHKMITPAQVINPRPHGMPADRASPKPVAAILPITGTEFPRQLTHWQKQQAKPKKAGK